MQPLSGDEVLDSTSATTSSGPEGTDAAATTLLLDQVEEDLLSFWLLSGGGGEEGDKAVTALIFKENTEELAAEGVRAKVLETFYHDLEPMQSIALVRRLRQLPTTCTSSRALDDPCGPDVLSPAALCARLQYLFALSQLEELLCSQGATKILAEAVFASRGFGGSNMMQALMGLTRDEIYADMSGAAVGEIADRVSAELVEMKKAAGIDNAEGSGNLKFVGDDDMTATVEGKYASESIFHEGLDKYIGLPDPKVLSAVINEHQNAANSDTSYISSNYNLRCTPREELEAALRPQPGKKYPGMGTGERKRELPPLRVYLSAAGCLDGYQRTGSEVGDERLGEKEVVYETEISSVLQELDAFCGPLELNEKEKVEEALCLLMMARQDLATTIRTVQKNMHKRDETGGTVNMEWLFKNVQAQMGWTEKMMQTTIQTGREEVAYATEINSVLQELEKVGVILQLDEEDKVTEAFCLLMMGRQGSAKTVLNVQVEMRKDGGAMNMELLFKSMKTHTGWTEKRTHAAIQTGRECFKKARLRPEEVLGIRLHTGPQFMHYNCVLRKFPVALVESLKGNTYTTTIHCINSAIVKLSRACPLDPRRVVRGSKNLRLPRQFAVKNKLGCWGAVELGFSSTTTNREVACDYAAGGVMAMVFDIERGTMDRGASIGPLSQYFMEEEILFPPLCNLEV